MFIIGLDIPYRSAIWTSKRETSASRRYPETSRGASRQVRDHYRKCKLLFYLSLGNKGSPFLVLNLKKVTQSNRKSRAVYCRNALEWRLESESSIEDTLEYKNPITNLTNQAAPPVVKLPVKPWIGGHPAKGASHPISLTCAKCQARKSPFFRDTRVFDWSSLIPLRRLYFLSSIPTTKDCWCQGQ